MCDKRLPNHKLHVYVSPLKGAGVSPSTAYVLGEHKLPLTPEAALALQRAATGRLQRCCACGSVASPDPMTPPRLLADTAQQHSGNTTNQGVRGAHG